MAENVLRRWLQLIQRFVQNFFRGFIRGMGRGLAFFAFPAWVMSQFDVWSFFPVGLVLLLPLGIGNASTYLLAQEWAREAVCKGEGKLRLLDFSGSTYGYFSQVIQCAPSELSCLCLLAWCLCLGAYHGIGQGFSRGQPGVESARVPKAALLTAEASGTGARTGASWGSILWLALPSLIVMSSVLASTLDHEWGLYRLRTSSEAEMPLKQTPILHQSSLILPGAFTPDGCLLAALEVHSGMTLEEAAKAYHITDEQTVLFRSVDAPWVLGKVQDGQIVLYKHAISPLTTMELVLLEKLSLANPRLKDFSSPDNFVLLKTTFYSHLSMPGDLRCSALRGAEFNDWRISARSNERTVAQFMALPVPSGLNEQQQLAYRCLQSAHEWGLATGSGPVYAFPAPNFIAFLKLTQTEDPVAVFQQLLQDANVTGRLYALAALYRLNRPVFDAQLQQNQPPWDRFEPDGGDRVRAWRSLQTGEATHDLWERWESLDGSDIFGWHKTLTQLLAYRLTLDKYTCKVEKPVAE